MHKNVHGKKNARFCLALCHPKTIKVIECFSLVNFGGFFFRYDRHREQILRGSDEYSDESLDVFQYFSASCYRGFDDVAGGFYAVYRDVFEKLAAEDLEFMDSDDEETIPGFGMASSDYEQVVGPFYAYWSSYCTRKSYAWLSPHNVQEIRDRRVLRHIEKDTKKLAQKARRERNDEVRALVSFVKKRDRRVIEYRKVLEERSAQNRLKQQEMRLAQIRRNQADVELMRESQMKGIGFGVDHEEQLRKLEADYRSDDSDDVDNDDDDDDAENDLVEKLKNGVDLLANGDKEEEAVLDDNEYVDHLYCVACNKSFKNESSMRNHEPSRKHRDNIERLRLEMLDEDDACDDDDDDAGDEQENTDDKKSEKATDENLSASETDDSVPIVMANKSKKKKKKVLRNEDDVEHAPAAPAKTEESVAVQKPKKSKKKSKKFVDENVDVIDNDKCSVNDVTAAASTSVKSTNGVAAKLMDVGSSDDGWSDENSGKKTTKKAAKKAKRAKGLAPMAPVIDDEMDVNHTCVTCKASFDSKNKLFAHLKKVGHGVYIEGKGVTAAGTRTATVIPTTSGGKSKNKKK